MSKLLLMNSRYLHPLVYFVADKPTTKNLAPEVPLVGTQSYKTLLQWIGEMNIDITRVRLYNQSDKPFDNPLTRMTLNKAIELGQIKVLALGKQAHEYLMKIGVDEYYSLPHPSGLNRVINNKKDLKEKLATCKNYVYGHMTEVSEDAK